MKDKQHKKTRVKAEKLRDKIEKLEEQLKRAVADYRNLECRIEKEVEMLKQDRLYHIVDKLLPVLDDLERAQKHVKDSGLGMVEKQFKEVLRSEGVREIKAEGEEFDPGRMDCAVLVKGKENRVLEVLVKGYMLNDKVIRPAKVKVGSGEKENK